MKKNTHFVSPLKPDAYWRPEWFEREQKEIFAANWIFAGFLSSLAAHNSYISTKVAGAAIIVRNMGGKIVAFRNACSHRHSQIHPEGCGTAAFRCPYHGWTFDAAGVPIGIPDNKECFGLTDAQKRDLALVAVAVEACGNYIFVRLNADGPPLRDWLGPMVPVLEHASGIFSEVYYQDVKPWACNWKGATEITIEGYHAPYVHADSFYKHVKVLDPLKRNEDTDVDWRVDYSAPHSAVFAPLSFETSTQLKRIRDRFKLPRSEKMRGYEHFIIYPNLMLAVYSGMNATVVRFDPLSPEQTKAERWLMVGQPADDKTKNGIPWRTVMKEWEREGTAILEEDRVACETAQLGVKHSQRHGLIGFEEQRCGHYHSMIAKDMGEPLLQEFDTSFDAPDEEMAQAS